MNPEASPRVGAPKVLIVEDEETIKLTLSYFLGKAGYDVTTCSSAEEARELVRKGGFFLLLADLVLEEKGKLDGLDMVRLVKKDAPDICVIVMTAYGDAETERFARARGADSYWDKPMNMEKLLEEIHRLEGASPKVGI